MLAVCLSGMITVHAAAQTAPQNAAQPSAAQPSAAQPGAAQAASASAPAASDTAPSASKPSTALTPELINNAGKAAVPTKRDRAAILRAQILLSRARFSPGEIDAAYGSNMRAALAGFQQKHRMRPTGVLDSATWNALNADSAQVLSTYTITDADVTGPFFDIPEDMADKAKLPALGYGSVEEALGERFHASPALLKELNPGKDLRRAGETIVVPNVLGGEPLPKAAKLVVDESSKTLVLFDAANKVIAQFPTSTGSANDPLPVGNWKINGVHKNPTFHYNPKLFWDSKPGEGKAVIKPGPNNPVGLVWVDLSKEHYGIHGTPVPRLIGKTESNGCIRLTNWDVMLLADVVDSSTQVVLQH